MMDVPTPTPVNIPLPLIEATAGVLLLTTPPAGLAVSVAVPPRQMGGELDILGLAFTVTTFVTKHPPGDVYVMVIVPADMPHTMPDVLTVPTAGVLLVQIPPPGRRSAIESPTQTVEGPTNAPGVGYIVRTAVEVLPLSV